MNLVIVTKNNETYAEVLAATVAEMKVARNDKERHEAITYGSYQAEKFGVRPAVFCKEVFANI